MKIIAYLGLLVLLAQDNLSVNCALRFPKPKSSTQVRSTIAPIVSTTTQSQTTSSEFQDLPPPQLSLGVFKSLSQLVGKVNK